MDYVSFLYLDLKAVFQFSRVATLKDADFSLVFYEN